MKTKNGEVPRVADATLPAKAGQARRAIRAGQTLWRAASTAADKVMAGCKYSPHPIRVLDFSKNERGQIACEELPAGCRRYQSRGGERTGWPLLDSRTNGL
jgi:hypothetical protein